jgi:lipopolysaccharide/colanic/teichoic acid biosynthesis glycosyltransferase
MKRLIDLVLALLAVLFAAPVLLGVAMAVYWHDRGQVFYIQKRVGRWGKVFGMLKFRSMVLNADKLGGFSTAKGDPRITPVGRFIRKTSLDELPQLLNVIMGHMSLVGPRPDVPQQQNLYSPAEWQLRHQVSPGITGLAQASLRSSATPQERKHLDLHYAQHATIWFDFKIMGLTVKQVLSKGGY